MASGSRPSHAFDAFLAASAGASGGVFAAAVLMPIEVAKTRISVSQAGDASIARVIRRILETEGTSALYNGVSVKMCEKGTENFVFYYIYEAIKQTVQLRREISSTISLGVGFISGVATMTTITPLEVLSTKLQVATGKAQHPIAVLRRVLATDGMSGLFKGYGFNLLLCINPAIQNTIFDTIKVRFLHRKSVQAGGKSMSLSALESLCLGACAKAIATLVTYPVTRLKTMLQADREPTMLKDGKSARRRGTPQLLKTLSFSHDKAPQAQSLSSRFKELYRGLLPTLLKGVLQAALMYMAKDQVERIVVNVLKKMRRQHLLK